VVLESRYFRLMALATIELLGTIPVSTWFIYTHLTRDYLYPYKGFGDTHASFWRVNQYPALLWTRWDTFPATQRVTRWSVVACGFAFFAFFGFADEARKHYRDAFNSVAKRVGFSTGSMGSSGPMSSGSEKAYAQMSTQGMGTQPSFVRPAPAYKRESVHSNSSSFRTLERRDSNGFPNPLTGHVTIADVVNMKKKDDVMSSSSATSSTTSLHHTPSDALRPAPMHDDEKYTKSPPAPYLTSEDPTPQTHAVPRPEVSVDVKSPPRHVADAPMSAEPAGTDDIV